jgi:hypothetical protein
MALRVATCKRWWNEQPSALFHGLANTGARSPSHLLPRISSLTREKKVNSSASHFMNQLTKDISARRFLPQFDCELPGGRNRRITPAG